MGIVMRIHWIRVAPAVLGATGVGAAAYYAHGLERIATEAQMRWWAMACAVQLVTAPVILALCLRAESALAVRKFSRPSALLSVGTVLFSGTLYLMALGAARWLGAITPIGGLLLMLGWLLIVFERRPVDDL